MQQLEEDGLISSYKWIPSDKNTADGLTKNTQCQALLYAQYFNVLMLSDGKEISGKRAKKQNRFILKDAADNQLGNLQFKRNWA